MNTDQGSAWGMSGAGRGCEEDGRAQCDWLTGGCFCWSVWEGFSEEGTFEGRPEWREGDSRVGKEGTKSLRQNKVIVFEESGIVCVWAGGWGGREGGEAEEMDKGQIDLGSCHGSSLS